MQFCDRVTSSIPKVVYSKNSWVKSLLPYYLGKNCLMEIPIENCMAYCLSATIPSDVGVSLTKIPAPTVAKSNVGACPSASTKTSEPFSSLTGDHFDVDDSDADEDWSHYSDDSSHCSMEYFCSDSTMRMI